MKITPGVLVGTALMGAALGRTPLLAGQNAADTPDAHVATARTAAGDSYQNLFTFLCTVPAPRGGGPGAAARGGGAPGGGRAAAPPAVQASAGEVDLVCRAGEGVRQPLLRRPVRILRLGA